MDDEWGVASQSLFSSSGRKKGQTTHHSTVWEYHSIENSSLPDPYCFTIILGKSWSAWRVEELLKHYLRAACLQNETAPKSFNFETKNGPKNDPKLPRKNLSLVLLCRISHRHYSKIFHREFPHKIKYFFTTRIRESEMTIKIKFALFRGGWAGGQGGKLSKTLFFMGNVMTIKFWKWKCCCREILLSWRRLLENLQAWPR